MWQRFLDHLDDAYQREWDIDKVREEIRQRKLIELSEDTELSEDEEEEEEYEY